VIFDAERRSKLSERETIMPYLELLVDTPKYKAGERAHFSKEAAAALTSIGTARILRSEETTDAEKGIAAAVLSWGIHRGLHSQRPAIVGRCSREVCGILKFEGRPEDAHLAVFLHGHAGSPPEKVPFAVLNAYVAAVKENAGELSPDWASVIAEGVRKGDSNTRRKLFQGYDEKGEPSTSNLGGR
jgi:hypothetical protein